MIAYPEQNTRRRGSKGIRMYDCRVKYGQHVDLFLTEPCCRDSEAFRPVSSSILELSFSQAILPPKTERWTRLPRVH